VAEKIVLERQKYAKKLESVVNRVLGEIGSKPLVIALNYVPSLKPTDEQILLTLDFHDTLFLGFSVKPLILWKSKK
jgi:recombinational DNA repair ATPase RecF